MSDKRFFVAREIIWGINSYIYIFLFNLGRGRERSEETQAQIEGRRRRREARSQIARGRKQGNTPCAIHNRLEIPTKKKKKKKKK